MLKQRLRLAIASLSFLLLSGAALAADIDTSRFDVPDAEIESKLVIPDSQTFKRMKDLDGTEFTVTTESGKTVTYEVHFYGNRIYHDEFQDGPRLPLHKSGGLLRLRARYDETKKGNYKLKKIGFQSKNGAPLEEEIDESTHIRSEVHGEEFKSEKKLEKKRKKLLSKDSRDEAVRAARESAGYVGDYIPIVSATQKRAFLELTPVGAGRKKSPTFYLSLDRIRYEGHEGAKGKASALLAELELGDDLSEDKPKVQEHKLLTMSAVSKALQKRYRLKPTRLNKYELGVKLTVLP